MFPCGLHPTWVSRGRQQLLNLGSGARLRSHQHVAWQRTCLPSDAKLGALTQAASNVLVHVSLAHQATAALGAHAAVRTVAVGIAAVAIATV